MKSNWVGFQSGAAPALDRYVAYKRALRRRFRSEERELRLLDRFLLDRTVEGIEDIEPELIDAFLTSRPRRRARSYNHLLGVVRGFFAWLGTQGLLSQSPVRATPRRETERRIPFLFNPAQARRLLEVADQLPDRNGAPLRGPTYYTIFALLYGLGLRVGEVSRLCWRDVDRERQLLVIRETKFSKSRLVPFGPRLAAVIAQHLQRRAQAGGVLSSDAPLFCFRKGQPVSAGTISQTFHHLWPRLGFTLPPGVAPPRVHDLRHAFAVGTLLRWYREGIDPSTRLLHLSTFLGHVNPDSTAVYLTITAELLQEANRRFEQFVAPSFTEIRR